jgi:hypothetical protein
LASSDCGQKKLSASNGACFEFHCANEGGLALEKTLIMETENTAQKMNLQRNARKGIFGECEGSAPGEANRVKEGLEKGWTRRRVFASGKESVMR